MKEHSLTQKSVDTLVTQLAGILDCPHCTSQVDSSSDEVMYYHDARMALIPSKEEPVNPTVFQLARFNDTPPTLDQSIGAQQNTELAILLNKHVEAELKQNTELTLVEIKRLPGGPISLPGGQGYALKTSEGDVITLRIVPNLENSNKGSISIKIDYQGKNPTPDETAVASLHSALVAAFEKAAPEFKTLKEKSMDIFSASPPPPPSPPSFGL